MDRAPKAEIRMTDLAMGRWPDEKRSVVTTALLIFVLLPVLCLLALWYVRG